MIRCGVYIRVSTDMQKERGESLETQQKRLCAYVDSKEGWSVVESYKDAGISAKNTNRTEFVRMMSDIEQGKLDAILCTKLDRMFRNTKDFLDITESLEKKNIKFVCLDGNIDTTTPTGRVFSTMRAAFAQFERETTAERVRDVMCSRAEQGKWNGGIVPYGYQLENEELTIHPIESEVVKKVYNIYLKRMSIRYVTQKLNSDGIKTRKGDLWSIISIRRILTNPFYYGVLVYNKRSHSYSGELKRNPKEEYIESKGNHPVIIELFDEVQSCIKQQSKIIFKSNTKYLMTGLIYCSQCGSRMHGMLTGRPLNKHAYYRCHGHVQKGNSQCKGNAIRVDRVESLIVDALKNFSKDDIKIKASVREDSEGSSRFNDKLKDLECNRDKIQTKRKRLIELYEDNSISKEDFLDRKAVIDIEEAFINKEIVELNPQATNTNINCYSLDDVLKVCKNMKDTFNELDIDDKKELLRNVLTEVKIDKHNVEYAIQILPEVVNDTRNDNVFVDGEDTGARAAIAPTGRARAGARRCRYSGIFRRYRGRSWTGSISMSRCRRFRTRRSAPKRLRKAR